MRRLPALLLISLLPFAAAGQSASGDSSMAGQLLAQSPTQMRGVTSGVMVPLWRGADGRMLMLKASNDTAGDAWHDNAPLALSVIDPGNVTTTGLQYDLGPRLQAHAEVSDHSWISSSARLVGSEVGATYDAGRYSLGISMGALSTPNNSMLPRVIPGVAPGINGPGVDGLSSFDSSSQLNARGRVALGSHSGIDLGASVGRIHLLPGNLLGIDTLDQKAVSLGIDHGTLSGVLTGRSMEPLAGVSGNYGTTRRWNSIDLGVTWRLPWRGSLSVGAHNLWSSGTPANTPAGPEPDQSPTPYVQYHQDL